MPLIVEAHPGVATSGTALCTSDRPTSALSPDPGAPADGPCWSGGIPSPPDQRPSDPAGRIRRNRLIDEGSRPTRLGESLLSHNPNPPDPDEVFQAFVRELASNAQPDLLARLKRGHLPDEQGWCRHTAHEHHWEHHPCTSLRLALLAEVQQRADEAGCDNTAVAPAQRGSPAVATPRSS